MLQQNRLYCTLRLIIFQVFDLMKFHTFNYGLFNKAESWSELEKLEFCGISPALVFAAVCKKGSTALEIKLRKVSIPDIVELD